MCIYIPTILAAGAIARAPAICGFRRGLVWEEMLSRIFDFRVMAFLFSTWSILFLADDAFAKSFSSLYLLYTSAFDAGFDLELSE